jgi:uncharacterized protein
LPKGVGSGEAMRRSAADYAKARARAKTRPVARPPDPTQNGWVRTGSIRLPPLAGSVLERFSTRLSEHFGPRLAEVRLFGSYARGEAQEDSDLDVFVLLDSVDRKDKLAIFEIAGELWAETSLHISPTVMDRALFETWRGQERPLLMEIEREGIRL